MKLTNVERSCLILLNRIMARLSDEKHEREYHERAATILEDGYYALHDDQCMPHLSDPLSSDDMNFVGEVMTMFRRLQWAHEKLSPKERKLVDADDLVFPGFDGNNEIELVGYGRFLIDGLGHFKDLKHVHGLNSHMPSVERYRRMLSRMPEVRDGGHMSVEEIESVFGRTKRKSA